MEELNEFIANYLRVADFRSISYENPVRFKLQPDDRTFIMSVSYTEPSFSQTPFNVLWICYDQNDTGFYGKLWRRVSADKNPTTPNKKYTWVQVVDILDMYSEDQYYDTIDETPSWDMGLSWADVGFATNEVKGFVLISPLTDGTGTKAVLANDERLTDKREPTEHDHNDFPRTMVHIAGSYLEDPQYGDRVNDGEVFVRFSVAKLPTAAGQVFKLTHNNPSRPNEWFGTWAVPTLEDFSGEPPVLVSANPYTESGSTSLSDNENYQLSVDSLYSDNTAIVGDTGVWSISSNSEGITINPNTGMLNVPDISSDTVVNVTVTTTDKRDSSVTVQGSISLSLRNTYTPVLPTSIVILGPDSVNEKNGTDYELQVFFSDGSDEILPATSFMSSDITTATITGAGEFDAKDIQADTSVTLTATFVQDGVTLNATKDVLVIAEIEAIGIEVVGPTKMNELTSIELEARVSLSDGSSYIADTEDVVWEFVNIKQGINVNPNASSVTYTSTLDIDADETFTLKVSGTFDGVYQEALHDVTVKDISEPLIPVLLEIIGEDSIAEGTTDEPYSFQVTYNNGVSSIINILEDSFTVNNNTDSSVAASQVDTDGSIIVGTLDSISDISENVTVTLSASYYENGTTVNATKPVIIVAAPAKPQTLTISGPTELNELGSIDLQAHAQMDDGNSILVSGTNSDHTVVWTFIQSATGVSQTSTGTAQKFESQVDINTDETFIVEASVTIEGVTVTDQYTVQLKDVPLLPVSLEIKGPTSVDENTNQTYTFEVTWSDGETSIVTPDSAGTGNGNFTLATDGNAVVGEFANDTDVTLNATYTHNGETVSSNLQVSVTDKIVPTSLKIQGLTEVPEQSEQVYTFEVTWSDGSTTTENPVDSINAGTDGLTFRTDGTLSVGDFTENTDASLWARFSFDGVSVEDLLEIEIIANAVPVSLEIKGPTEIASGDSENYTFDVTYSDSSIKTVTAESFVSDNSDATISGATVTAGDITEDGTVTLTATYTEEGATVTDTHVVDLKAPAVPQSIAITGPTDVSEDSTTGYTFVVTYSDSSTKEVTPNDVDTDKYQFNKSGQLTVPSVSSVESLTLSATYTEAGTTVTDTHVVNILNDVDDIDRIEITGNVPNPYYEGDDGIQLTAIVYYESGSTEDITNTGTWTNSVSDRGTISSTGFFTPNATLPGDTDFVIRCSPVDSARLGSFVIPVIRRPVTLSSIAIVGTSSMLENTSSNFTVEATFSNGDVSDVTSESNLSVESGSSGSFSGSTYTSPEVSSDTVHTIKATYNGQEATHDITVTDIPVPVSIEINGPTELEEGGNNANLSATVTYDDNSTSTVTTESTWGTSNPSVLSVNSSGRLTSTDNVSSDTVVTIDVSYTEEGETVTDTYQVTVTAAEPAGAYGPRWGTIGPQATGDASLIRTISDFDESFLELLDKPLTGTDGEKFLMRGGIDSFDNPDGGFAPYVHNRVYVAYPAALGWAKFVDDINNSGGMDGATAMPDESGPYTDMAGSVNLGQYANNGGIQVTIGGEDYIIYAQFMSSNNADYEMTVTYGGTDRRSGVL